MAKNDKNPQKEFVYGEVITDPEKIKAAIKERYEEIQISKELRKKTEVWPLKPPWVDLPGYEMLSLAWRMGGGEDIKNEFSDFFNSLTIDQRKTYSEIYPEPDGWTGFYEIITASSESQ